MNNRRSQKGRIDTNNRPLSKKSDAKIQQKPQQGQQQLHHQPKAYGGDDIKPSGGSARQTHNKFEVAPPNPFGAKSTQSDHAVRSNMESDGNRRPPKTTAARKCSSPKEEELECIRNTIKDAYEKFIGRKINQLYRPKTVIDDLNFYISKLIGCLSIVDCQHEERRTNRSNGTNREPNDGIPQISKEIKKLFNSMRDGTLDVKMKDVFRNEPDSAEDMLKCIEWSFRHYQQEFEWYRQEKKNVEIEIEKLAKDVCDTDAGTEKGIHEQISCIRLQIKQQKREYLTSVSMYEKEMSCVEEEVNKLVNEVNCINEVEVINKQCKLETKEDNEFRTVKIIRQIRRSLESQNCQTQERLRELENKSQYNRQVLGDLCSLLNMDLEPRQKEGSCIENSDLESIDKWKVIVENMKRFVKDRDQFVDHAGKLLKDVSTLISREPFSLTFSEHSYTKRVQVQEPDFQQLVYGMHNIKLCLEDYRKSHKEKFVKASTALNELTECRKLLQKEIEELKEEKDGLLNSLKELENRSQYNRQVFGDLCTLLKIDLEPRQKGGSNDNWKVIVENMKRLVKDRDQFVEHAGTLLKGISTLITREPFSLTLSGHSDTKRVQVLTPDFQQLVSGMHNVKLCLEDYRKSHKEKFVKIEAWTKLKECRKTLQKEIEELKEEKDVLLNRLKELENRSQCNRQVFGNLCTLLKMDLEPRQEEGSNDNWKGIVENIKRLVKDKDQFVNYAEKWLRDLLTLTTREPFSLTLSEHSDTKRAQVEESDFQQLVSSMHNVKLCLEDYRKSHKEKFVKIEAWNELREYRKRLQKEIEELKEEKDVLLNRLSKMAGANLTDNNPAIADLSDPNRATKLAEQFSELYDNSWTDAFEVLEISDEKECIQYLLNIIIESYSICADIANMQHRTIARALHYPTEGLINKTIKNEESNGSDVSLSKLQSRTLSDLRKTSADFSIEDVKSYISAKNENWVRKGELKQFTLSCIELCWFMHLQSPPVYLDATLVSGSTLDTNKYKPYTKSGKENDFIVWPSLYLHKGGPILCKGVAQGK